MGVVGGRPDHRGRRGGAAAAPVAGRLRRPPPGARPVRDATARRAAGSGSRSQAGPAHAAG
ncbi:hypothetical protein E0H75_28845 [Kribbella capetownensis]|uniref:Uncharacterized protein n=1 Tax=Kribbella capetownensis TaxID=1572659 RepID=A0A4R0JU62_9ACTN|nr:hypothetical protein E0H75_28845 [Kribbella capetownensis]